MSKSQISLRSVGILSICSFLQIGIQLGIQLVLARQFGTTDEMDAYYAAMSLPTVLSAFFVGSLNAAFIPVYMTYRFDEGEASAHRFSSQLGCWIFFISAVMAVVSYFAAEPIIGFLHSGFEAAKVKQSASIFRVLTWLTITNGLTTYLGALHHGEKRFRIPAFAGVIGVGFTCGLLLLEPFRSTTIGVSWAVLFGSIICVALQSKLFVSNFSWSFDAHPAMRVLLIRLAPFIAGSFLVHIRQLVDRYLASGQSGSISQLGYSWRFITAMLALTSNFPVVMFPSLSAQHAARQMEAFVAEVAHGLRFMAVILIPICIGLAVFSKQVVRDLFERGEFTAANTQEVAFLTVLFLGTVLASGVSAIAARALNALGDTVTPLIIIAIVSPIAIWLKFQFGSINSYGAPGLAAVTSVTFLLGTAALLFVVQKKTGAGIYEGLTETVFTALASTAVAIALSAIVVNLPIRFSALVAAPVGALSYLLAMYLMRNEFAIRFVAYFTHRTPTPGDEP